MEPGSSVFGYRDVAEEHDHVPVEVQGVLPDYIQGTMFRQCGGAFIPGSDLLDGLAHVAAWHLGSSPTFSNRFVRTRHHAEFVKSKGTVRNWLFSAGKTAGTA
eukprot:156591-Prymnesium_polylepis.1